MATRFLGRSRLVGSAGGGSGLGMPKVSPKRISEQRHFTKSSPSEQPNWARWPVCVSQAHVQTLPMGHGRLRLDLDRALCFLPLPALSVLAGWTAHWGGRPTAAAAAVAACLPRWYSDIHSFIQTRTGAPSSNELPHAYPPTRFSKIKMKN